MAGARFDLRKTLVFVAIVSFAAVAAALVSQHVFYLQPCPWCVLQRLIFVVIGMVALLGAALPLRPARLSAAALVLLLSLAGIAAALWQHFKAAASASCSLTWADKFMRDVRLDTLLPDIFAPRASCAEAAVNLLGVPYDFWSLGLFVIIGAAVVWRIRS